MLPALGANPEQVAAEGVVEAAPLQITRLQLVAIRKATDMPLTNRGQVRAKVLSLLSLFSPEVVSPVTDMLMRSPLDEIDHSIIPGSRERATGLDQYLFKVLDALADTIREDQSATGQEYSHDGSDNNTPTSQEARALWRSKLPELRLLVQDKPALEVAVNLAMIFSLRKDARHDVGQRVTAAEVARELNIPIDHPVMVQVFRPLRFESAPGEFTELNILERMLLKSCANNRTFILNEQLKEVFIRNYPHSRITPLLESDLFVVDHELGAIIPEYEFELGADIDEEVEDDDDAADEAAAGNVYSDNDTDNDEAEGPAGAEGPDPDAADAANALARLRFE